MWKQNHLFYEIKSDEKYTYYEGYNVPLHLQFNVWIPILSFFAMNTVYKVAYQYEWDWDLLLFRYNNAKMGSYCRM